MRLIYCVVCLEVVYPHFGALAYIGLFNSALLRPRNFFNLYLFAVKLLQNVETFFEGFYLLELKFT